MATTPCPHPGMVLTLNNTHALLLHDALRSLFLESPVSVSSSFPHSASGVARALADPGERLGDLGETPGWARLQGAAYLAWPYSAIIAISVVLVPR